MNRKALNSVVFTFGFALFASASKSFSEPVIQKVSANGNVIWTSGQTTPLKIKSGEVITIEGQGFGENGYEDGRSDGSLANVYGKVMFGSVRALERNLPMYEGKVDLLREQFYETTRQFDGWDADIREWTDKKIVVSVPVAAKEGPIVVQTQKRTELISSFADPTQPLYVNDPLRERWPQNQIPGANIARLGQTAVSNGVPADISNQSLPKRVENGAAIFWTFDYNIGRVHDMRGLDWTAIMQGNAIDPVTGNYASPEKLFGAIPVQSSEVPRAGRSSILYDSYPVPMPLKHLLLGSLKGGQVDQTGYVGYVYAESRHPVTGLVSSKIGFSCVSCHSQRIEYEASPGVTTAKVFPGLPNHNWSMKWNILGDMKGVRAKERARDGGQRMVDKTMVIAAIPNGTGEHTIIRSNLDDSMYDNDGFFSPSAIPIITRHLPVRRALSRAESISGFEGSYIHAEEPDGAIGAMSSWALQNLTTYMSSLDDDHSLLTKLGLYRWLQREGQLDLAQNLGEGAFMQTDMSQFAELNAHIASGKKEFETACVSCHKSNFGTNTDEDMIPLDKVGTFFSPTMFQRQTQSIRTAILHDMFWVEKRGLLHDAHVKNLKDLVDPDRCSEGTALYKRYYTIHDQSFKIGFRNDEQYEALASQAYFVERANDDDHLYWDYQLMRKKFGLREYGLRSPLRLPAAPHPWCATSASNVNDLVLYMLTL